VDGFELALVAADDNEEEDTLSMEVVEVEVVALILGLIVVDEVEGMLDELDAD